MNLRKAPIMFVLLLQNACDNCTNVTATNATNETEDVDSTVYARVFYKLYFPHMGCEGGEGNEFGRPDPLNVSLPVDANTSSYTLQEVMEAATDQDESYQFSVLFQGEEMGYLLEGVNGTDDEDDCRWLLYYQAPDEEEPILRQDIDSELQVSFFEVEPNATVVLCYQNTITSTEPTSTTSQMTMSSSSTATEPSTSSAEIPTETPSESPTDPVIDPGTTSDTSPLPTMPGTGGTGSDLIASTQAHFLISLFVFVCLCHP